MGNDVLPSRRNVAVKQFSLFADNKVGRMHDLIQALNAEEVTILGLCTVDTTDSAIMRVVVDYWECARERFRELGVNYALSDVVAVELPAANDLAKVTAALLQAEINIHYMYPLLTRPQSRCGLIIRLEDNEMAEQVLQQSGIKTLRHGDLAR